MPAAFAPSMLQSNRRLIMEDYRPLPKRKRGFPPIATIPPTPPASSPPHMRLDASFTSTSTTTDEDRGSGSPRTKVAYNFQGLQLNDDRFVLEPEQMMRFAGVNAGEEAESQEDGEVTRKRVKIHTQMHIHRKEKKVEIPETPDVRKFADPRGGEGEKTKEGKDFMDLVPALEIDLTERMRKAVMGIEVDPDVLKGKHIANVKANGTEKEKRSKLQVPRTHALIIRDSKSKGRKRFGTPPLSARMDIDDGEPMIIDEERAALTWHDDEITGHDPDDPDDDGEGINGIGFRPTAAEAYARTQKRKRQMLEYRNREAKDARAMRSQRRRGSEQERESSKEASENARRVRFMEEMTSIIS